MNSNFFLFSLVTRLMKRTKALDDGVREMYMMQNLTRINWRFNSKLVDWDASDWQLIGTAIYHFKRGS